MAEQISRYRIVDGNLTEMSDAEYAEELEARNAPIIEPVPQSISDRQFAHVLALQGLISQEEALAWVKTGDIPPALQSMIDDIPDPVIKFSAQMLLAGATVFERDHPMTAQLAAGLGMSSAQVDDLWRAAAAL